MDLLRYANMAAPSTRYAEEGWGAPAPRGLLLFARVHAFAVFSFLQAVFSCPPRFFLLFPWLSLFCLRARGFLLFGPVMLIAGAAAVFRGFGSQRRGIPGKRGEFSDPPVARPRAVRRHPLRSDGFALFPSAASERFGLYFPPGKRKSARPKKTKIRGQRRLRCVSSVARFWPLGMWVCGL